MTKDMKSNIYSKQSKFANPTHVAFIYQIDEISIEYLRFAVIDFEGTHLTTALSSNGP